MFIYYLYYYITLVNTVLSKLWLLLKYCYEWCLWIYVKKTLSITSVEFGIDNDGLTTFLKCDWVTLNSKHRTISAFYIKTLCHEDTTLATCVLFTACRAMIWIFALLWWQQSMNEFTWGVAHVFSDACTLGTGCAVSNVMVHIVHEHTTNLRTSRLHMGNAS